MSEEITRRLLVVDDEKNITELVALAFRYEGFEVATAATAREGREKLESFRPNVVILDIGLPDMSGTDLAKKFISEGNKVPIIFLTARATTEDKVHGLTVGGDDYMTKPFSIEELIARVRVVLKRDSNAAKDEPLRIGELELDDTSHEVWRNGRPIELTNTEYRLLRFLLQNAGRVLSRAQLLDYVWHYDFDGEDGVLDTYISYLRRKTEEGGAARLIQTVRGVGYVARLPRESRVA